MMRWNKRRSFTLPRSLAYSSLSLQLSTIFIIFSLFQNQSPGNSPRKTFTRFLSSRDGGGMQMAVPRDEWEPEKRVKIQQYNYWKTKSLKCGGGGHLVCERNRRQIRGENCIQYGRSCHIYFTWPISHANSILLTWEHPRPTGNTSFAVVVVVLLPVEVTSGSGAVVTTDGGGTSSSSSLERPQLSACYKSRRRRHRSFVYSLLLLYRVLESFVNNCQTKEKRTTSTPITNGKYVSILSQLYYSLLSTILDPLLW